MKIDLFKNLNKVLSAKERITSIDIWRGAAIIVVVLFHFNHSIPYGYLGVDLFFVISGLLVGGLLTKDFLNGRKINVFRFFLRRGFKIWPSYYTFLIVGTILAYLTYNKENSSQIIPFSDAARYLLFYQNYTGGAFHWSFDHVWSLCVEEHFYILLPLMFIVLGWIKGNWKMLFVSLLMVIVMGFVFKVLVLYFTHSKDTYSATHNRIDALGWGVLLNLVILKFSSKLKRFSHLYLLTLVGIIGFAIALTIDILGDSVFYHKVVFQSVVPICFFMMILGSYYYDFSKLKVIRIMGYYSYNWYLWHPVIVVIISQNIGFGIDGFILYLLLSFVVGVFFTVVVEEPLLRMRKHYMTNNKA